MEQASHIGNEDSYTQAFFEELYEKLGVSDRYAQVELKRYVLLAAQAYIRHYSEHQRQLPPHEIKKELEKTLNHIDKGAKSLIKIYASGSYGAEIVSHIHDVISENYPSLKSLLTEMKRGNDFMSITSPIKSLDLLAATADGIERTLKNYNPKKVTARSIALYHWLMIISSLLEKIMGCKLEQSHYYEGEYISKKEMGDSEFLLFIIKPLDSKVTISQVETALKETRKERHEAPWDDYF